MTDVDMTERARCLTFAEEYWAECDKNSASPLTLTIEKARAEAFEAGRRVSAEEGATFLSGHVATLQHELSTCKAKLARVEALATRVVGTGYINADTRRQTLDSLRAALADSVEKP